MLKKILPLLAIAAALIVLGLYLLPPTATFSVENTTIDPTQSRIVEIKKIAQWEFLTVDCETLVDTIRRRNWPITPDRLARIYRGTLRVGIDLKDAPDDWIVTYGDSVAIITLPQLSILDDRFIDEAATTSFYQSGKWSEAAKEEMYNRAASRMKSYALTNSHLDMARAQATARFTALFKGLGFSRVEVNFTPPVKRR